MGVAKRFVDAIGHFQTIEKWQAQISEDDLWQFVCWQAVQMLQSIYGIVDVGSGDGPLIQFDPRLCQILKSGHRIDKQALYVVHGMVEVLL